MYIVHVTGDDVGDKVIDLDNLPYIVWALGNVNRDNNDLVVKHSSKITGILVHPHIQMTCWY